MVGPPSALPGETVVVVLGRCEPPAHSIVGGNGGDAVGRLVQGDGRELSESSVGLGDPSEL